jgi:type I restriction enzyme M protein
LESGLWDAADIPLRPVDPGNFRDFIFPMLFLKRLSDTWDDGHARWNSSKASSADTALV